MLDYLSRRTPSIKRKEIEMFGVEEVSDMATAKLDDLKKDWIDYEDSIKEEETKYKKQLKASEEYSYDWLEAMQYLYGYETTREKFERWYKHWNRLIKKEVQENKFGYTAEQIQQARETPIEDLLTTNITRGGSGKQKTICPFHEEKTPSFYIYDDNSWHCYGCGAHGYNAIDFVMAGDISFKEAVEALL